MGRVAGALDGIMAPRASHLPNHRERSAMQSMRVRGELPLAKLYPTGKPTLERMLAKRWIVVGGSPETYRITPAGEAALKAKIPPCRKKRTSLVEIGLSAKK